MKVEEYLQKINLAYSEPSHYESGGWGKWNGTSWGWDCVCLIKGILWGWNNNKNIPRGGGANYGSNGVPDYGENKIITLCNNVSTDFSKIEAGEVVWMDGHIGTYIGNGEVIEATAGWNTWKVIKTQLGKDGSRTYNGQGGSVKWQKHGFLPYVDYTRPIPQPEPEKPAEPPKNEFKVGDKVVPIELVNWQGIALTRYDDVYTIMGIDDRGAILGAERNGELQVWAVLKLDNIKKVE